MNLSGNIIKLFQSPISKLVLNSQSRSFSLSPNLKIKESKYINQNSKKYVFDFSSKRSGKR